MNRLLIIFMLVFALFAGAAEAMGPGYLGPGIYDTEYDGEFISDGAGTIIDSKGKCFILNPFGAYEWDEVGPGYMRYIRVTFEPWGEYTYTYISWNDLNNDGIRQANETVTYQSGGQYI